MAEQEATIHYLPIVDWIGDFCVRHGERDSPNPDEACLCGFVPYYVCPGWLFGPDTIGRMTVYPADDGGQP